MSDIMELHLTPSIIVILRQFVRRIRAKLCLRKYLKLRLHIKRVERSYLCKVFNLHYIKHLLHTLIPYEESHNYISKDIREKYEPFNYWGRDLVDAECADPTYYSGRYYTQNQIDNGEFLYTGRSVTCRYKGMDYCGLFGCGTRGHAYHSCIGWCGSKSENEKCHNVKTREAVMTIVLAVKR
jgi:hypothetical protein